jgi:preprotein translocase subunit SecG
MVPALIIFACILAVLLILVVLIQNSKGGGLAGEIGGMGSNQLMGVKKTTDLLEQITWGFGIGIMVLTLASYVLIDKGTSGINSANVDAAQTRTLPGAGPVAPAAQQPAAKAPAAGTPPPATAPAPAKK